MDFGQVWELRETRCDETGIRRNVCSTRRLRKEEVIAARFSGRPRATCGLVNSHWASGVAYRPV
jgi:hypothetical protein